MNSENRIFSRDGTRLFLHTSPVQNPQKTVLLVHGFAEHIGRYQELTSKLNQAQISVFGIDLRGHGLSGGKRGYIDHLSQYGEDLEAAVSAVQKITNFNQIVLLAHSMGALVASSYAAYHPENLSGLILSSPLFEIAVKVPAWKAGLARILSQLWPAFSLPNTLEAKWLTHDPEKTREYETDPLVFHTVRARWFEQVMGVKEGALGLASRIRVPLLLQLSGTDKIVDFESSKQWFDRLVHVDCTLKVYEDFYHEIYNEIRREEPIQDLLDWLS